MWQMAEELMKSPAWRPLLCPVRVHILSYSARAATTTYHRPGDLNNRNLFPTVLEAWKFQVKVPTNSIPWLGPYSWFADGHLFCFVLTWQREREREKERERESERQSASMSLPLFIRVLIPSWKSYPHDVI